MTADVLLWIFAVVVVVALLFLMVYNLLAFDELAHDHKNPIDVCNSLNPLVLPEYIAQGVLTLLFLLTGNWMCALLMAPLTCYHVWRYLNRPMMSQPGIYDMTEMFNRDEMRHNNVESAVKLAFYMLTFFYFLYRMMYALLADDDKSTFA
ncbi:uncharacterized protein MONBRDRAFT_32837 [Monosiga brevicollis MX1]|uniref:Cornichon n=1 Tax=Monosiga brevicollis TaxID=81824 RepID=A9V205_MONBE|nr:uncharacterized protein MONBRDRAFT_32837 [Monosiga brevicollis MX1]EDQ88531.1 predicted protein [Monosiga brevicollis MX1]|eukprot:XP_001746635.1 hypothetical protein [Monosiga brevicollis MX1]